MVELDLQGTKELADAFSVVNKKLTSKKASDFWGLRLQDHRIDTQANFILKGTGKYEKLSEPYNTRKQKVSPGTPILVGVNFKKKKRSGRLKRDVSGRGNGTRTTIIKFNKKGFDHGTKLPYANYVQKGTSKMPARPFLLINEAYMRRTLAALEAFIEIK